MSNEIIKQKMIAKIRHEDQDSQRVISGVDHKLLRGIFREYGFVSIIRDLLPKNLSIGKGVIVDTRNNQSSEADIIIYDNTDISPFLFGPDSGVFPIESCRYVLEVKSESNATEIKDAIAKFSKLKAMFSMNGRLPTAAYFAFSTDLTGKDEFKRYFEYDPSTRENSMIDVLCVMNHGYWYKRNSFSNSGELLNTAWLGMHTDENYVEVLAFATGILNSLNRSTQLGYYLLENDLFPLAYINFLKMGFEIGPDQIEIYNTYLIHEEKQEYAKELETLRILVPDDKMLVVVLKVFGRGENDDLTRRHLYDVLAASLIDKIEKETS